MKYKDRDGNILDSDTSQDTLLKKIYGSAVGRMCLKAVTRPAISKSVGLLLDSRMSRFMIDPFVKKNHIDLSEYIRADYRSYNEFFTRQIKHNNRVIDDAPEHLITPCDGKLSVYKINDHSKFKIKDSCYSVNSLLNSSKLGNCFRGGYCVIIRLTVDNYHRYCYVDSGKKSANRFIPGVLHTVNPAALEHVKVYKENSREYTLLKTEHFGTIIQCEVGALMVGRITNHLQEGYVYRGFEKGMFEFGGSTVVLLIQPNKVIIDQDLIENTEAGYETIVKMGEKIGEANAKDKKIY